MTVVPLVVGVGIAVGGVRVRCVRLFPGVDVPGPGRQEPGGRPPPVPFSPSGRHGIVMARVAEGGLLPLLAGAVPDLPQGGRP
jgi:hypothetical protein